MATSLLASGARPPLEVSLELDGNVLRWEMRALREVSIEGVTWRSQPPQLLRQAPDWSGLDVMPGPSLRGVIPTAPLAAETWVEVRLQVRSHHGRVTLGASTRSRQRPSRAQHVVVKPRAIAANGVAGDTLTSAATRLLRARLLYRDRTLGRAGYTGSTQRLPLRHVDVELLSVESAQRPAGEPIELLARGRTDATGRLELRFNRSSDEPVLLRLSSTTRNHPELDVEVLQLVDTHEGRSRRPHHLQTQAFALGHGTDLGDVIFEDPDGFGAAQAFHIVDVAIDAWDAVRQWEQLQDFPTQPLRFLWGPSMRQRFSAFDGATIVLTSPGSGDTDGWSDPVILHEIGHAVAGVYLREDNVGGLHFLGDVRQDLRLAYSEGLATAFAALVRAWRAANRLNLDGAPVDAGVAVYIDAGLPPLDGAAGGAQIAWDLEEHAWYDGTPFLREGIGSETNVASTFWDLLDGNDSPDGVPGDDDDAHINVITVWQTLRAMREIPRHRHVTFEDFWRTATQRWSESQRRMLQHVVVEQSRIEFEVDNAEPDGSMTPWILSGLPRTPDGGIVINEVDIGAQAAVELMNRGNRAVDIGGWSLSARRNGASTNPGLTWTVPDGFVLGPGARVTVHRGGDAKANGARQLFAAGRWTIPWFPEIDGAVFLLDAQGVGVDFVRWDAADGSPSTAQIPAGTSWTGQLPAPGYGRSLSRRVDVIDRDQADDFVAAVPNLGAPHETRLLHRTFYPEGDTDALRWRVQAAGVYTLQTSRLRNGARPILEVWSDAAMRPRVTPQPGAGGATQLTLWLDAGEELRAQLRQGHSLTRLGTYEISLYAETHQRLALPPEGLGVQVSAAGVQRTLQMRWWNASLYDSLWLEVDAQDTIRLPGRTRSWSGDLALGRHRLQLAAFAGGVRADAPALLVAVEDWPRALSDDFESALEDDWELTGTWATVAAPGRSGRALTDSPQAAYAPLRDSAARLRGGIRVDAATTLAFDHICIVRGDDVASVEVTDNWGGHWHELARFSLHAHDGTSGTADWSDARADANDWVRERISLARFTGNVVQVRFRLQTNLNGSADGWFVDALQIEGGALVDRVPRVTRLDAAFPNPFNPGTRIRWTLAQPGHTLLRIVDVRGRIVRSLVDARQTAGVHTRDWDGRDAAGERVASGVYFARLLAAGHQHSTKLVLVR